MKRRNPWIYIPTLYFAEGLPYILVNTVSVIMYKKMGVSNQLIGLTSFFYLPWVLKMFWSPMVDIISTKRSWVIHMQLALAIALVGVALVIQQASFFTLTLVLLTVMAFLSATHDISIDGYYMLALNKKDQALFSGIRSTFYRIAVIFGSGLLVIIAGRIEIRTNNIPLSWFVVMIIAAVIFALLFLFHRWYLPFPDSDQPGRSADQPSQGSFFQVFQVYFRQEKIGLIILFILTYRLGEAFLTKMATPFLLDTLEAGGLNLPTETVGYVYGTVGVLSLVLGGICGGWLVARYGLRKTIWPLALALKAPDLVYVYMAAAKPGLTAIYPLVALEQFGYGMGFTAFMVFLMYTARAPYKTSHYAISTGIMALGMMIPGLVSGVVQHALGYQGFFLFIISMTIPGLLLLFFVPIRDMEKNHSATEKG